IDRRAGMRFAHASFGWRIDGFSAVGSWWMFQDSGSTELDIDSLQNIDAPFGYSRREFAAEERLGRTLGQEVDLLLGYRLSKALRISAGGAVLLPGGFYELPVARVAGGYEGARTSLGGDAMAWAASLGTQLSF
ncbi:MAG: hypothetical protein VX000_01985, partial [Myxococcota bacterium]|nr:hypothetical protein [Myxococcota bacterium]